MFIRGKGGNSSRRPGGGYIRSILSFPVVSGVVKHSGSNGSRTGLGNRRNRWTPPSLQGSDSPGDMVSGRGRESHPSTHIPQQSRDRICFEFNGGWTGIRVGKREYRPFSLHLGEGRTIGGLVGLLSDCHLGVQFRPRSYEKRLPNPFLRPKKG